MTPRLLNFPLHEWMPAIVPAVFETMVSIAATPVPGASHPPGATGDRISGAIGIAGETLTGAVYLHLSVAFAEQVTQLLLGLARGEAPAAADVNDVVGEFCNMTSGKLKAELNNDGVRCAMSPPSIIRGSAFAIEAMPGARMETFHFECLGHRLSVEIHLHPQDP